MLPLSWKDCYAYPYPGQLLMASSIIAFPPNPQFTRFSLKYIILLFRAPFHQTTGINQLLYIIRAVVYYPLGLNDMPAQPAPTSFPLL